MADWLDTMYKQERIIETVYNELFSYGRAFNKTGNETMGLEMFRLGDLLYDTCENIRQAVRDEIHMNYKDAQHSAMNMLSAALNATKLENDNV